MSTAPIKLTQPTRRDRSQPEATGLPVGPRTKPGKLYVYIHYPQGWEFVDRPIPGGKDGEIYGWLPQPQKATAHPGVNGVKDPGRGNPMTRQHMASQMAGLAAKGARILEPDDPRLGPYRYYDAYYDTSNGGRWYVEPGEAFTVLPHGKILPNSDQVIDPFTEFRRYLRDEAPDMIHPLMREYYDQFIGRELERLARCEAAAGVTPGLAYKVERQQARIAAMTAAYDAYGASLQERAEAVREGAEIAQPKRKRSSKGATA